MKRILQLLAFAIPSLLLGQTNVQKVGGGNNALSNGNIIVPSGVSITASGTGVISATAVPYTGITNVPTGTLLGRTTAATGAAESITIGTSLSMSALSINTIQDIRTTASPTFANVIATAQFKGAFGTAAAPGFSTSSNPDWGVYGTTTSIGFATGGVRRFLFDNASTLQGASGSGQLLLPGTGTVTLANGNGINVVFNTGAAGVATLDLTALTKGATATGSAAVLAKSLGLSENLYIGGYGSFAGNTPSPTADGQGYIGATTAQGLIFQGRGSSNDWNFYNKNGSAVLSNPTGTQTVTLPGSLASTTPSTGTLIVTGGIGVAATSFFGDTLTVSKNLNGTAAINISNTTSGTAALIDYVSTPDVGGNANHLFSFSTLYTTTNQYIALSYLLEGRNTGGLGLSATTGPIKLWTANALRATVDSSGAVFTTTISSPGGTNSERFGASTTLGTGIRNTAIGSSATTAAGNTATNTAVGYAATATGDTDIAVGPSATATGGRGIAIGSGAATSAQNYGLAIGYSAVSTGGLAIGGFGNNAAAGGIAMSPAGVTAVGGEVRISIGNNDTNVFINAGSAAAAAYFTRFNGVQPSSGNGGILYLSGGKSALAAGTGGNVVIQTAVAGAGTTLVDTLTVTPTISTFAGDLTVTGGNVGIGTTAAAAQGLVLTTTLSGSGNEFGLNIQPTFDSSAVSTGYVGQYILKTAASAFTMVTGAALFVDVPTIGATSAVTTLTGLKINNQGATGVTNAYGIDIAAQSGAATTNVGLRNAGVTQLTGSATVSGGSATTSVGALNLSGSFGGGITLLDTNYTGMFSTASAAQLNWYTGASAGTGFGSVTADLTLNKGRLTIVPQNVALASWTTTGAILRVNGAIITDNSTGISGTAATAVFNSFAVPTLAASNTGVTTTDAATVYIGGNVAAGTNMTITNSWGLWNVGKTRLDGATTAFSAITSTASSTASNAEYIVSNTGASGRAFSMGTGGSTTAVVALRSRWYLYDQTASQVVATASSSGTNNFQIEQTTISSSVTTGALVVNGGVGIAGAVFAGSTLSVTGTSTLGVTNLTATTVLSNGVEFQIKDSGGTGRQSLAMDGSNNANLFAGAQGPIRIGASGTVTNVSVLATTASSSVSTGAFVVAGGAGFSGKIYANNDINVVTSGSAFANVNATASAGTGSATFVGTTATTAGGWVSLFNNASESRFLQNPETGSAYGGAALGSGILMLGHNSTNVNGYVSTFDTGTNPGIIFGKYSTVQTGGTFLEFFRVSERGAIFGNASYSAPSWTTAGIQLRTAGSTYTDNSTAISGTAATATFASFAVPTLAATNATVTTTNAAVVYIAGNPTAGTNMTITNGWGLWNVGNERIDGSVLLGGTLTKPGGATPLISTNTAITSGGAAQTGTLTNAPLAGNPTKWVPINDNGTTRYIPAW